MRRNRRSACSAILALAAAIAVGACGGSKSSSRSKNVKAGTITILFAAPPDSLDPAVGYTSQALEPDSVAYIPPLTYAHASGAAGGKLIPGLATSLPTISPDGKTYTLTLRSGLKYSNGQPVKARDFTVAVERALKIPWGGSSFITDHVVGAKAYAGGAKTISGITTNDATGQITIKLISPYGAFGNVLAFPAFSPVPAGTQFKNEPTNPPPGVGPYKITKVIANVSYSVVKNPNWRPIPGIPSGGVHQITAKISPDTTANALAVLNGSADVFDFADAIPPSILAQVERQASGRYSKVVFPSTYYFFLNTKAKPFSSQLSREAVAVGIDRTALARLGSGFFVPGCYLLPPPMIGHATKPCPYGDPATSNLTKAKQLVQQSGMAGTPIAVWGEERSPQRQFVDYYTKFLNQIGFKATEKIIGDASYFPTIGSAKTNPQTGLADWNQDFPNPIDYYGTLMAGDAILPIHNQNLGQVNDPVINARVSSLYEVPSSRLSSYASQWQQLDYYAAQRAYAAVFGYAAFPKLTSGRIDYRAAVVHQVFGWDWLTLKTK